MQPDGILQRSFLIALSVALLAGCGKAADIATPTSATALSTSATSQATPTPPAPPTPTPAPSLDALLVPGPIIPAPTTIFFEAGEGLWKLPTEGRAAPVAEGLRIGPWSQTADATRAAAVIRTTVDEQETEEVRLISLDGVISEPVYGPITVSGDNATPRIKEMSWSWDSTRLAVVFANGEVLSLTFSDDPFVTRPMIDEIATPRAATAVENIAWAPNEQGIAYLAGADRPETLYVTPNKEDAQLVIDPEKRNTRAMRTFTWLPGRGRIAFTEGTGSSSYVPSSIFTVAPNGAALELLLSAGRFGPAASIGILSASPDGVNLAFSVETPDEHGRPVFASLWMMNIDSRETQQVPVEVGYHVTDVWWTASGLVWKGMPTTREDIDSTGDSSGTPFILGRFDPGSGTSTVVFQES